MACPPRSDSTHHRLYDFAKMALIKIFAHPYATVSITSLPPFFFLLPFPYLLSSFTFQGLWLLLWRRRRLWQMGRGPNWPLHWNWYPPTHSFSSSHSFFFFFFSCLFLSMKVKFQCDEEWVLDVVCLFGVDGSSSGVDRMREAWESQRKSFTAEFFEVDPCTVSFFFFFFFLYTVICLPMVWLYVLLLLAYLFSIAIIWAL